MEGLSFLSIIRCFIFYLSIELSLATLTINPRRFIGDGETFVSLSERFELGFFSPGNSKSRYLGIWHKECPGTVVWVANRNNPILDRRGVLCIGNYGNFILLNRTKDIIWSSDKSSRKIKNPVVHFLETGNLVLGESSFLISCKSYLWQSFDYPSDTLLPGMKLGRDLKTNPERYLMSWKSADDPSSGDFIFKLDIHVLPQISVYNGSMKISRSGLWNGVSFGGIPTITTSLLRQHLVHNEDEFYYMYEIDIPVIIKLNQAGEMQCLICSSGWDIMYTVPFDSCGMYGKCGANGVCSIDKTPICECLAGFVPQSLDNKTLPETCVRSSPFNCERVDRFIQLGGIKLPDLIEVSLIEGISLQECEAECLKNCSCRAYANSNVSKGGIGCLMWFGDLIDIRKLLKDVEGQDIYVRVPASEIGLEELQDTLFLVLSVILGMLMVFLSFCIAWKITKNGGNGHLITGQGSRKEDIEIPLFDLSTIATATNNFSQDNFIGAGGFGPVYKGTLSTGDEIAAKRLSKTSRQGVEEFRNEVNLIAKLQHRNLVGLLGCCIEGEEIVLIYEYMPNKSLDYFIFDQQKAPLLTWPKRFDIVMGIARGLLYLHQDSKFQIIHRDLKTSNILLDNELKPKISDFGLARIFRDDDQNAGTKKVVGTYGYISPECAAEGTYSVKSDVFSFGVVLLEVISGKRNSGFSHPDHNHNLLRHAWLMWDEKRALELIDSCFKDSCVDSEVLRCIKVGQLCVQMLPEDRPCMSSVIFMLSDMGASTPEPRHPGFFDESSADDKKEELHSKNPVTITTLEGR